MGDEENRIWLLLGLTAFNCSRQYFP